MLYDGKVVPIELDDIYDFITWNRALYLDFFAFPLHVLGDMDMANITNIDHSLIVSVVSDMSE